MYNKVNDTGEILWEKAISLIPNGNSLLSKQKTLFLPNGWPTYFNKTDKINVWDLDNQKYTDFIMSVGTNTLGYNNSYINEKIKACVSDGVMSSLNCPEEVELAERLVAMHPWSDMVKYARTGGEANAIAVRIARASTGKDKVAICGYHGWHDWYLAANLHAERLGEHLIPGLEAKGVNSLLDGSTHIFHYNKIEELEAIVSKNDLAAVIMEVERSVPPTDFFLEKVRKICSENGIVLIFDECTSGFRETFGGLHLKYGIDPDIAMFGKALGNGYAINAVIGRQEIMENAQSCFISSTNWTERIGPVAALATLSEMEKVKSWDLIKALGEYYREKLHQIITENNLSVSFAGLKALTVSQITSDDIDPSETQILRTLITKRLLKKGYLASNLFYTSILHDQMAIDLYVNTLGEVLYDINNDLKAGHGLTELLDGPAAHLTFGRLT